MKFSVPANWQDDLLPIFDSPKIDEVYGKLAEDYIGGGRPGYSLFRASKKKVARYIERVHKSNCKFNYLLNASCMGGREFTRRGKKEVFKLLEWLVRIGVDSVTISLPYIAEIVKKNFASLEVNVSVMAHVDSLQKAKFWESTGVHSITLLHTKVNRDFNLLGQIRKSVKCKLRLMANNHCLYNCPFEEYHETFSSHASQIGQSKGNFIVDYCYLNCRYRKISNPVLLISSPWIRPEDVVLYEQVGIDSIKLVDRRLPTSKLLKIINAYIKAEYSGNLLELFPNLCAASPLGANNILLRVKHFLNSFFTNVFMITEIKPLFEKMQVCIDNKALSGFINFFLTHNCQLTSCEDCMYCHDIAEKVVKIDKSYQDKTCERYRSFLETFSSR